MRRGPTTVGSKRAHFTRFDDRQLARPPVYKADNPSPRFAAVVLVGIVVTRAAAPSGEVTSAICRGERADVLIALGHARGAYRSCATSALGFYNVLAGSFFQGRLELVLR